MNYGTLAGANEFFDGRLFSFDWQQSSVANRQKALKHATQLIDQFQYIGQKYAVQAVITAAESAGVCPNNDDLQAAELSQPLQFPRGTVNAVPAEIEKATYLIAQALLAGRNPDMDLEAIGQSRAAYGDVSAQYDRGVVQNHIAHLIPSPEAFNLIRPFFRRRNTFDVKRV